jgi:Ser/Thr protein kinase RdoA (MazF antagonist)
VTGAPPAAIAAAWGWRADQLRPLAGGLINETYVVGDREAVVQRLHPVFAGEVNLDIEAVTGRLAARGLATPRLIRTGDGRAWVDDADGRAWRALTFVPGTSFHAVPSPAHAGSAGALVGRFHRAVADFVHTYAFARAGVHDTAAHLARLGDRLGDRLGNRLGGAGAELADARALAADILAAAAALPALPQTPHRHCHGDLKISNVMFEGAVAACLVDLDTVGLGTIAFELGDAMRSWCNPRGEDVGAVGFDLPIFAAAIGGFLAEVGALVSRDERVSIVVGLETVCIELAARFAVDVFDDRYFGWDATRFASRRAHNLVRARGQLALGLAVRAVRADALAIVLTGA